VINLVLSSDSGLELWFPPVAPLTRQELTDLPTTTVPVQPGPNSFSVGQDVQEVHKIAVHFMVAFSEAPAGSVTASLGAPDGTPVSLGTYSSFEPWPASAPTEWRLIVQHPATPPDGDLSTLLGVQPGGDWTLELQNDTGLTGELTQFRVLTVGRLAGVPLGHRADRAETIALASETTGRVVHGTTLGLPDDADLDCAATHAADLDGDGINDGAPDRFYEFTIPEPGNTVDLSLMASFGAALELRQGACEDGGAVLACDDDGGFGPHPAISGQVLSPGTYCVVVDGVYDDGGTAADPADDVLPGGPFDLFIEFASPIP